ncbi:MAG: hypothetical protein H6999_10135 [Hahellaceae bacterium]|nr:hypothetical protein [Hahellaceae bacterium]
MNEEPVIARIKSKFDLGYIVELEDGQKAQLRLPEQKGRELKHHIEQTEELLYGEDIPVYVTYKDEQVCSVSQFSCLERREREELEQRKAMVRENCAIGDIYTMEIDKELEWGYICCHKDGYLSGAIKKPTLQLELGQKVTVVVVGKNKFGSPYFEIEGNPKNA